MLLYWPEWWIIWHRNKSLGEEWQNWLTVTQAGDPDMWNVSFSRPQNLEWEVRKLVTRRVLGLWKKKSIDVTKCFKFGSNVIPETSKSWSKIWFEVLVLWALKNAYEFTLPNFFSGLRRKLKTLILNFQHKRSL